MIRCLFTMLVTLLVLGSAGCYQAHSDDDLRAIPATNNPRLLPESSKGGPMPKAAF